MLILCIADVERDVGMKNLSPKEAITILEGMRIDIPVPKAAVTQIKRNLALDMAINALNCSEFPNNSATISRTQAIDAMDSEMVSTNPEHFNSSEKFIKFMDDADIASFGKWQWANGFNTGVVAAKIQLKKLPSAQPEIIRCKDCKYYKYGICMKIGANKSFHGFCDWAERGEQE